jgi:hypothetical protein
VRMWCVPPNLLCRNHLLGEHHEVHAFIGTIYKRIRVGGYIERGLLNPRLLWRRHQQLVDELLRRGYNHYSPLPIWGLHDPSVLEVLRQVHPIDARANIAELYRRCPDCRQRIRGVLDRNDADRSAGSSTGL